MADTAVVVVSEVNPNLEFVASKLTELVKAGADTGSLVATQLMEQIHYLGLARIIAGSLLMGLALVIIALGVHWGQKIAKSEEDSEWNGIGWAVGVILSLIPAGISLTWIWEGVTAYTAPLVYAIELIK